jgi:hypothetical protein
VSRKKIDSCDKHWDNGCGNMPYNNYKDINPWICFFQ